MEKLPRLLEEGRVEVRLSSVGGTHVFEESGVDRLLKHLLEAKDLLHPVEVGSPEHVSNLYLERKLDVARLVKIVRPYLMEEADKADELDQEEVTVTVSSVYSACDAMAFVENLVMYEKGLRAAALEEAAQLMEIQSPHLFCDPDDLAGQIRALAEKQCNESKNPEAKPLLDRLVDKFLAWPLPESVCADLCATRHGTPHRFGTNLLTAIEARQMLEYLLNG